MRHASSTLPPAGRPARRVAPALLLSLALVAATPAAAAPPAPGSDSPSVIATWNQVAVATIPVSPAAFLNYAFVHLAMYNAVNGITREYELYEWHAKAPPKASPEAAAAVAAHRILTTYFPGAAATLDAALVSSVAGIPAGVRKDQGIRYGLRAADRIIELRTGDGRGAVMSVPPAAGAGDWRPTSPGTSFAVPWLGQVTPLALGSLTQLDPGPPPAIGTALYRAELEEVRLYGAASSALRSADETALAHFVNAIPFGPMQAGLRDLAGRHRLDISDSARLFAAANVSIADAIGTAWNAKLAHLWWRPITAIRELDDDGDPLTVPDPTWTSLIAAPPYAEWPSGLCSVVGAVTQTLQRLTGGVDLYLTSPVETRHFVSKTQLDHDAVDARVWSGIHFRTADEVSIDIGTDTANWVLDRFFQPAN